MVMKSDPYSLIAIATFILIGVTLSYVANINTKLNVLSKNLNEFIEPITDLPDVEEN